MTLKKESFHTPTLFLLSNSIYFVLFYFQLTFPPLTKSHHHHHHHHHKKKSRNDPLVFGQNNANLKHVLEVLCTIFTTQFSTEKLDKMIQQLMKKFCSLLVLYFFFFLFCFCFCFFVFVFVFVLLLVVVIAITFLSSFIM